MPMNEQPPWGKKKKPKTPEDILAQIIQNLRNFFEGKEDGEPGEKQPDPNRGQKPLIPGKGMGLIFILIALLIALQGLYISFFTISPGEVGVVLRFGKYQRMTNPGPHFKIPYVEQLIKVDVEAVRKEEFGFRSGGHAQGESSSIQREGYDMESLMLTGDKNVIEVAWVVQYKVSDPVHFLFKVRDVSRAVRDASEMVVRRLVGNMDFDYVLSNRDTLAAAARQELQDELDHLEAGVNVVTIQLQDINPPERVKPAFNEVNKADQDMMRLVNEAEKEYNRVIPKARGDAKGEVEAAKGYAIERVNRAKGEVARFQAILKEYRGAEQVTRQRLFLETMEDILPNVERLYIMDASRYPALPFLNLQAPAAPKAAQPQP